MLNNTNKCSHETLFLGIDGGGTKCKARLEDSRGNLLGEGFGGPANIVRSVEDTITAILSATNEALWHANLTQNVLENTCAFAGLAGANVQLSKEEFNSWQHPFANFSVTTDMEIACVGAHQEKDGSVIIIGTGFCAGTKVNGQVTEMGGYGMFLGDQASGASIGLKAVQHCFKVLDGVKSACLFSDTVLTELNCSNSDQLLALSLSAQPSRYAQLAPVVFNLAEQENNIAVQIVTGAAQYVEEYARYLSEITPHRISLIGGIAKPLTPWLNNTIREQLCPALSAPELGAVSLARKQLTSCICDR